MHTAARRAIVLLVIGGLGLREVQGQTGPLTVRLGASVGKLDEHCAGCSGVPLSGFSRLAVEGQLLKRVGRRGTVGLEGMLWRGTYLGLYRRAVVASLTGSYRPVARLGLLLDAGAGYLNFQEDAHGASRLTSEGIALQGGAGYLFRAGSSVSFVPFVRYLRAVGTRTRTRGATAAADLSPRLLRFGLLLQWR